MSCQLRNTLTFSDLDPVVISFSGLLIQVAVVLIAPRGELRGPGPVRSPPLSSLSEPYIYIFVTQYYTPAPTASYTAPVSSSMPAPTPPSNPPPTNPVMSFAPVTVLPLSLPSVVPPAAAQSLNGPQTAPLPHRRTCRPTYHPDHPGIDVETHSLEASKSFYVAIPARDEGIYTSSLIAREKSEGIHNGHHEAAKTYAEAKGLWALGCLRWHGHECKRERLQRLDRTASTGRSRASTPSVAPGAAFRIAEDADLDEIHIRGHRDISALADWLEEDH
ncbi:hypothetical protein B0H13DRAFT_2335595 [Mycena leptocephala]|nr:hypothetical protein B0H13DRAFT_2335595 [Mycena leptocephala]